MKRTVVIITTGRFLSRVLTSALVVLLILTIILVNPFRIMLDAFTTLTQNETGAAPDSQDKPGGKLAIIIDDFGSDRNGVKEMMSIDRHLNFAIMPFLKYSAKDAEDAYDKGYEVIIHLPMEPVSGKKEWLGPRPIMADMGKEEIQSIVQDAIEDVPHARGANIHMGSKASSKEDIMAGILEVVSRNGLYFVDSRTSSKGIAAKLAQSYGIACYDRHIFLDEGQPYEHVKAQLAKAMALSISKGEAVAIGHVGQEGGKTTARAIEDMLPEFDKNNVSLVFISELSGQQPGN